jgi:hypothetical protein
MPDIKDAASGVKDKATDAATGNLRDQVTGAFTGAARDIIGPAVAQMSNQAAEQAVAFAKEQGPKLVREQVLLNLDMAPSGLREKMVRGFRFHKRGVRGDFHRFSAWVQHRSQDELDELEGWLGTIKGGQITQTHEEYVDAHEEEQERAAKRAEREQEEGADDETDEANGETEADAQDEGEDEPEGDDEGDDEGDSEEAGDDDEDEANDDEDGDDDSDDDEGAVWEEDEDDDYDELDVAGLRSELRARDLPSRGSRQALIDRLREDDQ